MRIARFAGMFYEQEKSFLIERLGNVIKPILNEENKSVKAGIVPHAGYVFSGRVAGKVYSYFNFLKQKNGIESKPVFVILGTNHTGIGKKVNFSLEDFETPLGLVKTNRQISRIILEKCSEKKISAGISEEAHKFEHSVEVQLPFLQFIFGGDFEIVPMLVSNLKINELKSFCRVLSEINNENVFFIASSDFTHYGKEYGFTPFSDLSPQETQNRLKKLDLDVVNEILSLNLKEFLKKSSETTVCGSIPIAVLIELASLNNLKSELVDYFSSGEASNDWNHVVGYAGLIFY